MKHRELTEGKTLAEISQTLKISQSTLTRYLKAPDEPPTSPEAITQEPHSHHLVLNSTQFKLVTLPNGEITVQVPLTPGLIETVQKLAPQPMTPISWVDEVKAVNRDKAVRKHLIHTAIKQNIEVTDEMIPAITARAMDTFNGFEGSPSLRASKAVSHAFAELATDN